MKVEETKINGFSAKKIYINNIILGIPTDIGPRILYLAMQNRPEFNLFGILPESSGTTTPEGFWRSYGGHRLWSAPEAKPRSYSLDDKPVKITIKDDTVTIYGNPEVQNSTVKKITLKPFADKGITVIHSIKNVGRWPIRLSCWALSVMRREGFAIIPLKPSKIDKDGLLPDRHVSFWPYADLSDERLIFADGYIFVKQNPKAEKRFKVGAMANPSWIAYWISGLVFVKEFERKEGEYPDFGCDVEVYTNWEKLEIETLGPLKTLNPSESLQHTEVWRIFDVGELQPTAKSIDEKLVPLLHK